MPANSTKGVSVEAIDSLSPRDVDAWRDLARRSLEPNPFFEPDFALPAARRLGSRGVALLVRRVRGDWLGCLPVQPLGRAPLRLLASWRHPYCFLGTPLVDANSAEETLLALVGHVGGRGRGTLLALRGAGDDRLLSSLRAAAGECGLDAVFSSSHERATLERRPAGNYLEGHRAHHRRELARLRRRLSGELGGELELHDRAGEPQAVERFLSLEASGWKGRKGTALASNPAHADFFREICGELGVQGRLQLLSLEADGRPVAMKCNIGAGDALFCFKIAHDEGLQRFSPGVQLEAENIDVFHAGRRERLMDSCADPDNEMINRLWPDRRSDRRPWCWPAAACRPACCAASQVPSTLFAAATRETYGHAPDDRRRRPRGAASAARRSRCRTACWTTPCSRWSR